MFLFSPFRAFLLPSSEDPQAQKIYNLPEKNYPKILLIRVHDLANSMWLILLVSVCKRRAHCHASSCSATMICRFGAGRSLTLASFLEQKYAIDEKFYIFSFTGEFWVFLKNFDFLHTGPPFAYWSPPPGYILMPTRYHNDPLANPHFSKLLSNNSYLFIQSPSN